MNVFKALAALIAVFTLCSVQAGELRRVDGECIVYESPSRTAFQEICRDVWSVGQRRQLRETPSQDDDFMASEVVGEALVDCSDGAYRCVSSWTRTYAVPRRRLIPKDSYATDGVEFRVEKCIRGDDHVCQVAIIGGYCRVAPVDHSSSGNQPVRAANWRYVTYFIFNEDFGITAMGVTPAPVKSTSAMLAIANQSVLQGREGLLKE